MIGIHTLLTVKYILYWSGCIVYMFLGTDNQLICLFLDISVTMTTCTPIHWGIGVCQVWYSWWPHGQEFSDLFLGWGWGSGVVDGCWWEFNLIVTSRDEGGIQRVEQSNFNMVIRAVPTKPTHCHWCHRAWTIHSTFAHTHIHIVLRSFIGSCMLAKDFLWIRFLASTGLVRRHFSSVSLLMGSVEGLSRGTEDWGPAVFLWVWQGQEGEKQSSMALCGTLSTTRTSKAAVNF